MFTQSFGTATKGDLSVDSCLYFAYGSNMCTRRLQERVPSAFPRMRAFLRKRSMRFHKRGLDGSGKCTIHASEGDEDLVWGVVFEIHRAHRARLDNVEGLGSQYHAERIVVHSDHGAEAAFTYVAAPGVIDPSLRPFDWYKQLVVMGAREHGLPGEYVAILESVQAHADPDVLRAARAQRLLRSSDEKG